MNNWRAAGYIFLGWVSVFLIYALIVFLSLTSIFSAIPSLAQATIALAANAPWLIIASLAYVNGVVCYYARRENAAMSDEANVEEMQEYVSQPVSSKIDSLWSFPVGVAIDESYEIKRVDLDFFTEARVRYQTKIEKQFKMILGLDDSATQEDVEERAKILAELVEGIIDKAKQKMEQEKKLKEKVFKEK